MNSLEGANLLLKYNMITKREYAEILAKGLKPKHITMIAELLSKGKK